MLFHLFMMLYMMQQTQIFGSYFVTMNSDINSVHNMQDLVYATSVTVPLSYAGAIVDKIHGYL